MKNNQKSNIFTNDYADGFTNTKNPETKTQGFSQQTSTVGIPTVKNFQNSKDVPKLSIQEIGISNQGSMEEDFDFKNENEYKTTFPSLQMNKNKISNSNA